MSFDWINFGFFVMMSFNSAKESLSFNILRLLWPITLSCSITITDSSRDSKSAYQWGVLGFRCS
jgi:hypothetical protein